MVTPSPITLPLWTLQPPEGTLWCKVIWFFLAFSTQLCGTSTTVETTVAETRTQWLDKLCNGAKHHDVPLSLSSPPDTLTFPNTTCHVETITPSKVNLYMIKWMLHNNLCADFLYPLLDEPTTTVNLPLLPPLDLNSNLTSITKSCADLDAIKQEIHCSLHEDFQCLQPSNSTLANDQKDPISNPNSPLTDSKEPKLFNKENLGMPAPLIQQSPCSNHLLHFWLLRTKMHMTIKIGPTCLPIWTTWSKLSRPLSENWSMCCTLMPRPIHYFSCPQIAKVLAANLALPGHWKWPCPYLLLKPSHQIAPLHPATLPKLNTCSTSIHFVPHSVAISLA